MTSNDDMNVAPVQDGYRLTPRATRYFLLALVLCSLLSTFVPKSYELLRVLGMAGQFILVGIIVGNYAPIWSRPKLARIRQEH